MKDGDQSPYWAIEIEPLRLDARDTLVQARVFLVGAAKQLALYKSAVAWKSLKSDLIQERMGCQLFQPEWAEADKVVDRLLSNGETVKGQLDASVSPDELKSIGFKML